MTFVAVAGITGAVVGLTQLGMGIAKSVKAKKAGDKAADARTAAQQPLNRAVQETNQMKNITQGAGMGQAQANARQVQADTIGQAGLQQSDPNKMAAIASRTNLQGLKAAQNRDAITERQRLQGQRQYTQALTNQASGLTGQATQMQQQAQNQGTEASNLMGAGVGNIVGGVQGGAQLSAYGMIEAGTWDSENFWQNTMFRKEPT